MSTPAGNSRGRCAWSAEGRHPQVIQAVRLRKLRGLIVALYKGGMSGDNIAKFLRCSHGPVYKQLHLAGVKFRKAGVAARKTCHCGKPVVRMSRCLFHARVYSAMVSRKSWLKKQGRRVNAQRDDRQV